MRWGENYREKGRGLGMVEVIATIFEITFGKRKEWVERRRGGEDGAKEYCYCNSI